MPNKQKNQNVRKIKKRNYNEMFKECMKIKINNNSIQEIHKNNKNHIFFPVLKSSVSKLNTENFNR